MKQDEIIEMAMKVGGTVMAVYSPDLVAFAKLVAAKERETCAKVCDELVNKENSCDYQDAANWCSIRIRARGQA